MSCDYFMFLLVRTNKEGRVSLIASSDNQEALEKAYLFLCKQDEEDIKAGKYRYDIYKAY